MQYQVGDKVLVKSIDWYNANKQPNGFIMMTANNKISSFTPGMAKYCGQVFTIDKIVENSAIYPDHYRFIEDKNTFCWVDDMIERIATDDEIIESENTSAQTAPTSIPVAGTVTASATASVATTKPEVKSEPVKEEEKTVEKVIENPIASFVAKAQTTVPIETIETPVEKPVEKKTRKKKLTQGEAPVLTSTTQVTSAEIQAPPTVRHDFCKVELRCDPDSEITFQDALRIAASIDVLKNYGVNINCVIEYVDDGKLCDLSFSR